MGWLVLLGLPQLAGAHTAVVKAWIAAVVSALMAAVIAAEGQHGPPLDATDVTR